MTLKLTVQGGLIYLTTVLFLATAVAGGLGHRNLRRGFWAAAFVAATASVVWRGLHTGHPPMQNLFEFFLCMAAALWPLSQWSRRKNNIDTVTRDALLGVVILFPAGFIFSEEVRRLPPALQSPLFIPHVASYVAGYVMMARAALIALPLLRREGDAGVLRTADLAARQTAATGFMLLTSGLLLGAIWGKICWGHYWHFDPKEMWSLATWLVYGGYFHYRLKHGIRSRRVAAALLWVGLLFVILTLTWINLSKLFTGLHNYA
jgi:ABC-type transport system involved in cytochrome c biogenesis permease subunit